MVGCWYDSTLSSQVEECCEEKKVAAALFMNVKGAFNQVSKSQLIAKMIKIGVEEIW